MKLLLLKRSKIWLIYLFPIILCTGSIAGERQYEVIDLGILPGDGGSAAYAINDLMQAVGSSYTLISHSFLWEYREGTHIQKVFGEMKDLGGLSGVETSEAKGINIHGQVVGRSGNAFLWEHGEILDLGTLGGTWSDAYDINKYGQVVGYSINPNNQHNAFYWEDMNRNSQSDPGEMINLGTLPGDDGSEAYAINDLGQVVGSSFNNDDEVACLWEKDKNTTVLQLPTFSTSKLFPGYDSRAQDINNNGQVVGAIFISGTMTRAFLWEAGETTDLSVIAGFNESWASSINDSGQVVGHLKNSESEFRAFLWENGIMKNLNNLIPPSSGWVLRFAYDINNAGQIVGFGLRDTLYYRGFLLKPEPIDLKTSFEEGFGEEYKVKRSR